MEVFVAVLVEPIIAMIPKKKEKERRGKLSVTHLLLDHYDLQYKDIGPDGAESFAGGLPGQCVSVTHLNLRVAEIEVLRVPALDQVS